METTPSKTGDAGSTNISQDKNEDKPAFEPRKGKVLEYTRIGVWDLYQERDQLLSYLPTSWKIDAYAEMWNDLPYLWKTIRDLASVAWPTLSLYLVLTLARALIPALTLWCVRASPFDDNDDGILTAFFQVFWTTSLDRECRPELLIPTKMFSDCFVGQICCQRGRFRRSSPPSSGLWTGVHLSSWSLPLLRLHHSVYLSQ
jgi:hypothetical protein